MNTYTIRNYTKMLGCDPLNWEVHQGTDHTLYVINIGSLDEMWQCSYRPDKSVLSFTSLHYSKDEVYRFRVHSHEEASKWVLRFAEGMNRTKDLDGTIYTDKSQVHEPANEKKPTARQLLNRYRDRDLGLFSTDITQMMREFAKMHVKAALEKVADECSESCPENVLKGIMENYTETEIR